MEPYIREQLSQATGLTYTSQRFEVGSSYVQIDAVGRDEQGQVRELVDIYARQGKLNSAQKKKATDDAARLHLARIKLGSKVRCRLVWCCPVAVDQITNSWRSAALAAMDVSLEAIPITEAQRRELLAAQKLQVR